MRPEGGIEIAAQEYASLKSFEGRFLSTSANGTNSNDSLFIFNQGGVGSATQNEERKRSKRKVRHET